MIGPSHENTTTVDTARLSSYRAGKISWNTLVLDYPFSEKYTRLETIADNSGAAARTKAQIEEVIERICQDSIRCGIDAFATRWALVELLTNATQYAGVTEGEDRRTLVSLEWVLDEIESDPCLILAVSNTIPTLFNPAKYSNTSFTETLGENNQGHMNLVFLVGKMKEGCSLSYQWKTPIGEGIRCALSLYRETDPDRPEAKDEFSPPMRITASKYDSRGDAVPYLTEQFLRDVNKVPTTEVTATCIIGR